MGLTCQSQPNSCIGPVRWAWPAREPSYVPEVLSGEEAGGQSTLIVVDRGNANFLELRKAEVQLRRRPTSGSSATEGPPPPRPPYALLTLSHRGLGRPGLHRISFSRS